MLSDEATSPPTLTCAVLPKIMPEGLSRNTWPFELSEPIICVGFWSVMRFSAVAVTPGWLKVTDASEPILKAFQLAINCCVDWFTVIWFPLEEIVPLPVVILPPVGREPGSRA